MAREQAEHKQRRRSRAFTLIELLVVIVILGILMAVALPTYLRQQSKAKDSAAKHYLEYAYRVVKGETVGNGNSFPSSTSLASAIQQSEPELTVTRAGCSSVTTARAVAVAPVSTSQWVVLCDHSDSGNLFALDATPTGVVIGQVKYTSTVLASAPTGFWPLSETAGTTATDLSTGAHNGTYAGGFTLGQPGAVPGDATGTLFDGSTGVVSTGLKFGGGSFSGFTLEAWVTCSGTISSEHWIEGYNGQSAQLNIESGGKPSIYLWNGSWSGITSAQKICDGKWHYLAGTWDGATLAIYVDGALSATSTPAGPATDNNSSFAIASNGAQHYPGSIQEAAVYNRALSASEIAAHYAAAVSP